MQEMNSLLSGSASKRRALRRIALLGVCVFGLCACSPERDINDQLIVAARANDIQKVHALIEKGADINAREKVVGEGETALFRAASMGHNEIVKLLLASGAMLQEQPNKPTALIMATWGGHTETVRTLLENGANPNAKSEGGWTAIAHASRKGYFEIARLLIEKGAEVNVQLPDGNTPLSWAKATENPKMVELLKRAGARGS